MKHRTVLSAATDRRLRRSVDADGRRSRYATERSHAADPVPGIPWARLLALAFITLQEPGHEELFGQGGELDPAGLAVLDHARRIVEVDHFDRRARLRRVIRDLVVVLGAARIAGGQTHERVA